MRRGNRHDDVDEQPGIAHRYEHGTTSMHASAVVDAVRIKVDALRIKLSRIGLGVALRRRLCGGGNGAVGVAEGFGDEGWGAFEDEFADGAVAGAEKVDAESTEAVHDRVGVPVAPGEGAIRRLKN